MKNTEISHNVNTSQMFVFQNLIYLLLNVYQVLRQFMIFGSRYY